MQRRGFVVNLLGTILVELSAPLYGDGPLVEDFIDDVTGLEEVLKVREVGHLGVLEVHQGAVFVLLLEGTVEGGAFGTGSVALALFGGCTLFQLF